MWKREGKGENSKEEVRIILGESGEEKGNWDVWGTEKKSWCGMKIGVRG